MRNSKGRVLAGTLMAAAVLLFQAGCGGNDSGDDSLLPGMLALTQQQTALQQEADTAAQNLALELSGMIIPESGSTASAMSAQSDTAASRHTRALTCSGNVCNGIIDCPSGGTSEYVDVASTSSANVSGNVTTIELTLTGRTVRNACASPRPRIVNGVLDITQTATVSGTTDITSFNRTSVKDNATGVSNDTMNSEIIFTTLSIDGAAPATGNLSYQVESTSTTTGKNVSTKMSITYSGTLNGFAVSGTRAYEFSYSMP